MSDEREHRRPFWGFLLGLLMLTACVPSPDSFPSWRPWLACVRAHESDTAGGYQAVGGGGAYHGAYQFVQSTWDGAVARAGFPEWSGRPAEQAPPSVQDAAAVQLASERGDQPWGNRCIQFLP